MGRLSVHRTIAAAAAVLAAGASLAGIGATVTATPAAAAHSGTKFNVSSYGTVVVSGLPTAPSSPPPPRPASTRGIRAIGAVTPNVNTQGPNDLEEVTSAPAYTNPAFTASDTRLARGDTQLVQVTAADLRIFGSSGALVQTVTQASFWKASPNQAETDDLAYDAAANRYLMVGDRLVGSDDQMILAVSNADDATGTWTLYPLETETNQNRGFVHVRIGFGSDKILIGDDDVDGGLCTANCRDGHLVVLQRSDVIARTSVRGIDFNLTNGVAKPEFVTPAVPVPSQTKTTAYAAYMETNAFGHRAGVFVVTGTPAAGTTDYNELLTGFTSNPDDPTTAREPGGLRVLPGGWDDIAQGHGGIAFESVSQAQSLVGQGVILWLADNVQCNPGGGNRVCVKLVRVQVNSTGTTLTDTWENTIKGAPADDFYQPSVVGAPVTGRVFVQYTHSSTSLPPRAEVASFIPTGTATISNLREVSFASGTQPYNDGEGPSNPVIWGSAAIVAEDLHADSVWVSGLAATGTVNTWQSEVAQYTVDGPTVSSITPGGGAPGTQVTIDGSGFTRDALVAFGNVPATKVTFNSQFELVATAPAQPAGTVDVTVTTPKGTSAISAVDQYVYPAVVWTSLNGSSQVQAYNTITGSGPLITVSGKPQGIAVSPDSTRVVVATTTGASVIDPVTDTVIAKFTFAGADDVAIFPDSDYAMVTTPNALQVIDMTVSPPVSAGSIPVPGSTKLHDIAITSDNNRALVTDPTGNKLWNIQVSGVVLGSKAFTSPEAITVNGATAWLTTKAATTGTLVELDASTLAQLGSDPFDGDPMAVATTPADDYVYVSLTAAGRLMSFQHTGPGATTPIGSTTLTGDSPLGVVVLPNGTAGYVALNATTAPAQLETFASPPPGAGPVNIGGKNPFDVAVATPTPLVCSPTTGVTPVTVTPGVSNWPTHDDFSVVAAIGSCGGPVGGSINASFKEVFTPPASCVAPPPGMFATTLAVGENMVPAQFVAMHCTGNWSVTVTVTNTATSAQLAKTTQGFVVS